jgi:hypothetical protein
VFRHANCGRIALMSELHLFSNAVPFGGDRQFVTINPLNLVDSRYLYVMMS